MKAIAYVSDVILGQTGQVISREVQKELIRQCVEENHIEVVAWFEDEVYAEDLLHRPGIQKMMKSDIPCDCLLVERTWSLSRNWNDLEAFMKELDSKGIKLESATLLWDCVSQKARQYYRNGVPRPRVDENVIIREAYKRSQVIRPSQLRFLSLQRSLMGTT